MMAPVADTHVVDKPLDAFCNQDLFLCLKAEDVHRRDNVIIFQEWECTHGAMLRPSAEEGYRSLVESFSQRFESLNLVNAVLLHILVEHGIRVDLLRYHVCGKV